jgi:malonyl-CoA O-methyltransferase
VNNFNKKAHHYASNAKIQQIIANDLYHLCPSNKELTLDLGMGPGVNLKKLLEKSTLVLGVDIAPNMVIEANNLNLYNSLGIIADAHNLNDALNKHLNNSTNLNNCVLDKIDDSYIKKLYPFQNKFKQLHGFDMIFSSLALQWCNLDVVLKQLKYCINKNCFIAIAFPIEGTLNELKIATEQCSLNAHINQFLTEKEVYNLIKNSEFKNLKIEFKTYYDKFDNIDDFLYSIRGIGANQSSKNQQTFSKKNYLTLRNYLHQTLIEKHYLTHTYKISFIYGNI